VHNSHGLPLILGVQVLTLKPWKLTSYLMVYWQHIRRLDVNGSHQNRTGDREEWVERTHKHRQALLGHGRLDTRIQLASNRAELSPVLDTERWRYSGLRPILEIV